MKSNRTDLVLRTIKEKKNMPMPTDSDMLVKDYNKISKYKNQEIEIEKKCGCLNPPTW